jgi:mannosyltransferase
MDAASALDVRAPTVRWSWRITPLQLTALLILLALTVRAIGLGTRPLWLDEAYSLAAIERTWHDLWVVVPTYETHPPFYYSLLKLWSSVFGSGRTAVRGLSVLFSVATIPMMIAAALELESQDPSGRPLLRAGICGFLAACSPVLVFFDQQARPYALMVLAYAVATLGVLRLLREFRAGGAGSLLSWAALCTGTELTLWSHSLGVLYASCLALALVPAWLERPVDPERLQRGIVAAAVVLLLYVPCLLIIASQVGDWGTSWLSWEPSKLLELVALYSVPVEALTVGSAIAALIMLLLIKRAVQRAVVQPGWTSGRALLLLWWGPPLLAVVISAVFVPVFLPRTLAATLVPAYLAIGGALARIASPRERLLFTAALAITLMPTALQTAIQPASERWDDVSAYLERSVAPTDEVWLYPNDSSLPLRQAAPHAAYRIREIPGNFPAMSFHGINRSGSPAVPSLTPQQAEQVAAGARLPRTIWLVTRQRRVFDPNDDLRRALVRSRHAGKMRQWGYIVVQPFTLKASSR